MLFRSLLLFSFYFGYSYSQQKEITINILHDDFYDKKLKTWDELYFINDTNKYLISNCPLSSIKGYRSVYREDTLFSILEVGGFGIGSYGVSGFRSLYKFCS